MKFTVGVLSNSWRSKVLGKDDFKKGGKKFTSLPQIPI